MWLVGESEKYMIEVWSLLQTFYTQWRSYRHEMEKVEPRTIRMVEGWEKMRRVSSTSNHFKWAVFQVDCLWSILKLTNWVSIRSLINRWILIILTKTSKVHFVLNDVDVQTSLVILLLYAVINYSPSCWQHSQNIVDLCEKLKVNLTRKPCYRKETARCTAVRCGIKFADIHYKFKSSQAPKVKLQSYRHTGANRMVE